MKSKLVTKMIAAICLLTFSAESVSADLPIDNVSLVPPKNLEAKFIFDDSWVPKNLGKVSEVWGNQEPSLILIQDAHGQYQAQKNIQTLLDLIQQKRKIEKIFIEGGVGELDKKLLELDPDPSRNEKILDVLAQHAELGGPELFWMERRPLSSPGLTGGSTEPKFCGVEDPEIYSKNLIAFQQVYRNQEKTQAYLTKASSWIQSRASKDLNPELYNFFKIWFRHQLSDQQGLPEYTGNLKSHAAKTLNLNLQDPREQLDWPMLVRFFEIKSRESKLDPEKAEKEYQQLQKWLDVIASPALPAGRQAKAGAKQSPPLFGDRHVGPRPPRDDMKQSRRTSWETFYEKYHSKGFDFKNYPNYFLREGSLILQEELEAPKLFEEIEKLSSQLLNKQIKNANEEKLIREAKQLIFIQKLLRLELTREEYEGRVIASPLPQAIPRPSLRGGRRPTKFATMHWRIRPDESADSFGGQSLLLFGDRHAPQKSGARDDIEEIYQSALRFYQLAIQRDEIMINAMSFPHALGGNLHSEGGSPTKAFGHDNVNVLIAGGFHTPGLTKLLQQQNIPYAVITPHLPELQSSRDYVASMLDGTPKWDLSASTLRNANLATPAQSWRGFLPPEILDRGNIIRKTLKLNSPIYPGSRAELRMQSNEAYRFSPANESLYAEIQDAIAKKMDPWLPGEQIVVLFSNVSPRFLGLLFENRAASAGLSLEDYKNKLQMDSFLKDEILFYGQVFDFGMVRAIKNYPTQSFEQNPAIAENLTHLIHKRLFEKEPSPMRFRLFSLGDSSELEAIIKLLDQIFIQAFHRDGWAEKLVKLSINNSTDLAAYLKLNFEFYDIRNDHLLKAEAKAGAMQNQYAWFQPQMNFAFLNVKHPDSFASWQNGETTVMVARNLFVTEDTGKMLHDTFFLPQVEKNLEDGGIILVDPYTADAILNYRQSVIFKAAHAPLSKNELSGEPVWVLRRITRSENETVSRAEVRSREEERQEATLMRKLEADKIAQLLGYPQGLMELGEHLHKVSVEGMAIDLARKVEALDSEDQTWIHQFAFRATGDSQLSLPNLKEIQSLFAYQPEEALANLLAHGLSTESRRGHLAQWIGAAMNQFSGNPFVALIVRALAAKTSKSSSASSSTNRDITQLLIKPRNFWKIIPSKNRMGYISGIREALDVLLSDLEAKEPVREQAITKELQRADRMWVNHLRIQEFVRDERHIYSFQLEQLATYHIPYHWLVDKWSEMVQPFLPRLVQDAQMAEREARRMIQTGDPRWVIFFERHKNHKLEHAQDFFVTDQILESIRPFLLSITKPYLEEAVIQYRALQWVSPEDFELIKSHRREEEDMPDELRHYTGNENIKARARENLQSQKKEVDEKINLIRQELTALEAVYQQVKNHHQVVALQGRYEDEIKFEAAISQKTAELELLQKKNRQLAQTFQSILKQPLKAIIADAKSKLIEAAKTSLQDSLFGRAETRAVTLKDPLRHYWHIQTNERFRIWEDGSIFIERLRVDAAQEDNHRAWFKVYDLYTNETHRILLDAKEKNPARVDFTSGERIYLKLDFAYPSQEYHSYARVHIGAVRHHYETAEEFLNGFYFPQKSEMNFMRELPPQSVQQVLDRELPVAMQTLRSLIEYRAQMDKEGGHSRPLLIWQNMRLGEMYPFFMPEIKKRLGILEISSEQLMDWEKTKTIPDEIGKARYLLVQYKVPSAGIGDVHERILFKKSLGYLALQIRAPIVMIDHSPKYISNAQNEFSNPNWSTNDRGEWGEVAKEDLDVSSTPAEFSEHLKRDSFLISYNPSKGRGSWMDGSPFVSEWGFFPDTRFDDEYVQIGDEVRDISVLMREAYAAATNQYIASNPIIFDTNAAFTPDPWRSEVRSDENQDKLDKGPEASEFFESLTDILARVPVVIVFIQKSFEYSQILEAIGERINEWHVLEKRDAQILETYRASRDGIEALRAILFKLGPERVLELTEVLKDPRKIIGGSLEELELLNAQRKELWERAFSNPPLSELQVLEKEMAGLAERLQRMEQKIENSIKVWQQALDDIEEIINRDGSSGESTGRSEGREVKENQPTLASRAETRLVSEGIATRTTSSTAVKRTSTFSSLSSILSNPRGRGATISASISIFLSMASKSVPTWLGVKLLSLIIFFLSGGQRVSNLAVNKSTVNIKNLNKYIAYFSNKEGALPPVFARSEARMDESEERLRQIISERAARLQELLTQIQTFKTSRASGSLLESLSGSFDIMFGDMRTSHQEMAIRREEQKRRRQREQYIDQLGKLIHEEGEWEVSLNNFNDSRDPLSGFAQRLKQEITKAEDFLARMTEVDGQIQKLLAVQGDSQVSQTEMENWSADLLEKKLKRHQDKAFSLRVLRHLASRLDLNFFGQLEEKRKKRLEQDPQLQEFNDKLDRFLKDYGEGSLRRLDPAESNNLLEAIFEKMQTSDAFYQWQTHGRESSPEFGKIYTQLREILTQPRAEVRSQGEEGMRFSRRRFLGGSAAAGAKAASLGNGVIPAVEALAPDEHEALAGLNNLYDLWPKAKFLPGTGFGVHDLMRWRKEIPAILQKLGGDSSPEAEQLRQKEMIFHQELRKRVAATPLDLDYPRSHPMSIQVAFEEPDQHDLWDIIANPFAVNKSLGEKFRTLKGLVSEFEFAKSRGMSSSVYLKHATDHYWLPFAEEMAKRTAAALTKAGVPTNAQELFNSVLPANDHLQFAGALRYADGYFGSVKVKRLTAAAREKIERLDNVLEQKFANDFHWANWKWPGGPYDDETPTVDEVVAAYRRERTQAALKKGAERALKARQKAGAKITEEDIREELEQIEQFSENFLDEATPEMVEVIAEKYHVPTPAERVEENLNTKRITWPYLARSPLGMFADYLERAARYGPVELFIQTGIQGSFEMVTWFSAPANTDKKSLDANERVRLWRDWQNFHPLNSMWRIFIPHGMRASQMLELLRKENLIHAAAKKRGVLEKVLSIRSEMRVQQEPPDFIRDLPLEEDQWKLLAAQLFEHGATPENLADFVRLLEAAYADSLNTVENFLLFLRIAPAGVFSLAAETVTRMVKMPVPDWLPLLSDLETLEAAYLYHLRVLSSRGQDPFKLEVQEYEVNDLDRRPISYTLELPKIFRKGGALENIGTQIQETAAKLIPYLAEESPEAGFYVSVTNLDQIQKHPFRSPYYFDNRIIHSFEEMKKEINELPAMQITMGKNAPQRFAMPTAYLMQRPLRERVDALIMKHQFVSINISEALKSLGHTAIHKASVSLAGLVDKLQDSISNPEIGILSAIQNFESKYSLEKGFDKFFYALPGMMPVDLSIGFREAAANKRHFQLGAFVYEDPQKPPVEKWLSETTNTDSIIDEKVERDSVRRWVKLDIPAYMGEQGRFRQQGRLVRQQVMDWAGKFLATPGSHVENFLVLVHRELYLVEKMQDLFEFPKPRTPGSQELEDVHYLTFYRTYLDKNKTDNEGKSYEAPGIHVPLYVFRNPSLTALMGEMLKEGFRGFDVIDHLQRFGRNDEALRLLEEDLRTARAKRNEIDPEHKHGVTVEASAQKDQALLLLRFRDAQGKVWQEIPISRSEVRQMFELEVGKAQDDRSSFFYSAPNAMKILQTTVLPKLVKRHQQDKKIRVLEIGSGTNEMLLTLAAVLWEGLDQIIPAGERSQWKIEITGVEKDENTYRLGLDQLQEKRLLAFDMRQSEADQRRAKELIAVLNHHITELDDSVHSVRANAADASFYQNADLIVARSLGGASDDEGKQIFANIMGAPSAWFLASYGLWLIEDQNHQMFEFSDPIEAITLGIPKTQTDEIVWPEEWQAMRDQVIKDKVKAYQKFVKEKQEDPLTKIFDEPIAPMILKNWVAAYLQEAHAKAFGLLFGGITITRVDLLESFLQNIRVGIKDGTLHLQPSALVGLILLLRSDKTWLVGDAGEKISGLLTEIRDQFPADLVTHVETLIPAIDLGTSRSEVRKGISEGEVFGGYGGAGLAPRPQLSSRRSLPQLLLPSNRRLLTRSLKFPPQVHYHDHGQEVNADSPNHDWNIRLVASQISHNHRGKYNRKNTQQNFFRALTLMGVKHFIGYPSSAFSSLIQGQKSQAAQSASDKSQAVINWRSGLAYHITSTTSEWLKRKMIYANSVSQTRPPFPHRMINLRTVSTSSPPLGSAEESIRILSLNQELFNKNEIIENPQKTRAEVRSKEREEFTWFLNELDRRGYFNLYPTADDRAFFEFDGKRANSEKVANWPDDIYEAKKKAALDIVRDRLVKHSKFRQIRDALHFHWQGETSRITNARFAGWIAPVIVEWGSDPFMQIAGDLVQGYLQFQQPQTEEVYAEASRALVKYLEALFHSGSSSFGGSANIVIGSLALFSSPDRYGREAVKIAAEGWLKLKEELFEESAMLETVSKGMNLTPEGFFDSLSKFLEETDSGISFQPDSGQAEKAAAFYKLITQVLYKIQDALQRMGAASLSEGDDWALDDQLTDILKLLDKHPLEAGENPSAAFLFFFDEARRSLIAAIDEMKKNKSGYANVEEIHVAGFEPEKYPDLLSILQRILGVMDQFPGLSPRSETRNAGQAGTKPPEKFGEGEKIEKVVDLAWTVAMELPADQLEMIRLGDHLYLRIAKGIEHYELSFWNEKAKYWEKLVEFDHTQPYQSYFIHGIRGKAGNVTGFELTRHYGEEFIAQLAKFGAGINADRVGAGSHLQILITHWEDGAPNVVLRHISYGYGAETHVEQLRAKPVTVETPTLLMPAMKKESSGDTDHVAFQAQNESLAIVPRHLQQIRKDLNVQASVFKIDETLHITLNSEHFNPLYQSSKGHFSRLLQEIAKAAEEVIETKLDAKVREQLKTDEALRKRFEHYLNHTAVEHFIFIMQHVLYENTHDSLHETIKSYLEDRIALEDGAKPVDHHVFEKYASAARTIRPFSRPGLLHTWGPQALVYEEDPQAKNPENMVVEKIAYQLSHGRAIPYQLYGNETVILPGLGGNRMDVDVYRYPPEKIVFARWRGRRFMFYVSRTHTPKEGAVHTWRQAEAYYGIGWILKQNPENFDDVPAALAIALDEILEDPRTTILRGDVGHDSFVQRTQQLGFFNFSDTSRLEAIFAAPAKEALDKLRAEYSQPRYGSLLGHPQIAEAFDWKVKEFSKNPSRSEMRAKKQPILQFEFTGNPLEDLPRLVRKARRNQAMKQSLFVVDQYRYLTPKDQNISFGDNPISDRRNEKFYIQKWDEGRWRILAQKEIGSRRYFELLFDFRQAGKTQVTLRWDGRDWDGHAISNEFHLKAWTSITGNVFRRVEYFSNGTMHVQLDHAVFKLFDRDKIKRKIEQDKGFHIVSQDDGSVRLGKSVILFPDASPRSEVRLPVRQAGPLLKRQRAAAGESVAAGMAKLEKRDKLFNGDFGGVQNASQSPAVDFAVIRDDQRDLRDGMTQFDVASALADFDEAFALERANHFATRDKGRLQKTRWPKSGLRDSSRVLYLWDQVRGKGQWLRGYSSAPLALSFLETRSPAATALSQPYSHPSLFAALQQVSFPSPDVKNTFVPQQSQELGFPLSSGLALQSTNIGRLPELVKINNHIYYDNKGISSRPEIREARLAQPPAVASRSEMRSESESDNEVDKIAAQLKKIRQTIGLLQNRLAPDILAPAPSGSSLSLLQIGLLHAGRNLLPIVTDYIARAEKDSTQRENWIQIGLSHLRRATLLYSLFANKNRHQGFLNATLGTDGFYRFKNETAEIRLLKDEYEAMKTLIQDSRISEYFVKIQEIHDVLTQSLQELEALEGSRSEVRKSAVVVVAQEVTGRIVAVGSAVYRLMFPRKLGIKMSDAEKQKLVEIYTKLFEGEGSVMLPAEALNQLSDEGLEEYLETILESLNGDDKGGKIYITGDADGRIKNILSSSKLMKKYPLLQNRIRNFIRVEAQSMPVILDRIKESPAVSILDSMQEQMPRLPGLVIKAEEIKNLGELQALRYLHRLTQVQLVIASLLPPTEGGSASGGKAEVKQSPGSEIVSSQKPLLAMTAREVVAETLRQLGIAYVTDSFGFFSPNTDNILSDELTSRLASAIITARAA